MRKWTRRMCIQFNIAAHEICAKLKPHGSVNRLYYMASSSSGQDERNRALHLPHYNAENDHRKRRHSKTLSRVERFENDAFWKRCFVVWTEKTMLSENDDVIKIDTTGRQTTRPWISKMAGRRYHMASISRQFRGLIYWNAHASSSLEHAQSEY